MRNRIGFLKNAIAKINGYFSRSGEKLASARLSQEEVDAFNNQLSKKQVKAKPAKPKTSNSKPIRKNTSRTVSASVDADPVPVVHAVKEEVAAVEPVKVAAAVEPVKVASKLFGK